MRLLGKVLAIAAQILVARRWSHAQTRLVETYANYKAELKSNAPQILIATLIAGEDRRFYEHTGVDGYAILRAMFNLIIRRRWDGGSTLEQQLVRTLTHEYQRTLFRKLREIMLATLVRTVDPKSDIPGLYLSVAYFGWRMNGLLEACDRLNIDLRNLTIEDAARIVARLKYPEPREPSARRSLQIARRTAYLIQAVTGSQRVQGNLVVEVKSNATDATV